MYTARPCEDANVSHTKRNRFRITTYTRNCKNLFQCSTWERKHANPKACVDLTYEITRPAASSLIC